ncbi:hypothetical protein KIPB_013802, partial [Kipferlia bialata]|eukprot:g13802.t1
MSAEKKAPLVQDKSVADRQLTAEQLLQEAFESRDIAEKAVDNEVMDEVELADYHQDKRQQFETRVSQHGPSVWRAWVKYAKWEENQEDYPRARSIYERSISVAYRERRLWMAYAEFEMRRGNPNATRNVFERACKLLPREDDLWI